MKAMKKGKREEGRGEIEEEEKEGRRWLGRNEKCFIYPQCRIQNENKNHCNKSTFLALGAFCC
jgi:hypothetical protein